MSACARLFTNAPVVCAFVLHRVISPASSSTLRQPGARWRAHHPEVSLGIERTGLNVEERHTCLQREQWFALFSDAYPGYITFEQFEANQATLLGNAQAQGRERDKGPAREGSALLQGLAICGNCGRRSVRYHIRRGVEAHGYQCMRECIDSAASRCLLVPGSGVDTAIGQLLLGTLTPPPAGTLDPN